jgi:cytidylate kinase
MPIITISRQLGSLGTEIAKRCAEKLKLNFLDKESLEMITKEFDISEGRIEKYDEKKPSFWDRFSSDRETYLHFLKTGIYEFAYSGSCLILGRGGQVLLKDVPGVLHVRIIAPLETRLQRVKDRYEGDEWHARQLIQRSDHDRSGFHRFFFNTAWDYQRLYDLIINTATLSVEKAVGIIERAAPTGARGKKMRDDRDRSLADRCLEQKVITKLLYDEKIPIGFLKVSVVDGAVTFGGSVNTVEDIERCKRAIDSLEGVREVTDECHLNLPYNDVYFTRFR